MKLGQFERKTLKMICVLLFRHLNNLQISFMIYYSMYFLLFVRLNNKTLNNKTISSCQKLTAGYSVERTKAYNINLSRSPKRSKPENRFPHGCKQENFTVFAPNQKLLVALLCLYLIGNKNRNKLSLKKLMYPFHYNYKQLKRD